MQFDQLTSLLETNFPKAVLGFNAESNPGTIQIEASQLMNVCEYLHSNEQTYFDSLSNLSGIDNGQEESTMEVMYNLYSIPFDIHLMVQVKLDRNSPQVASVANIWRAADWHEREAYDLLGIRFLDHPDLRRILLPEDWEGHPLRKDYEEQEIYHEVKVKY